MKLNSLYSNRRPFSSFLPILSALALAPASMGAVLVNFEQVGDDVRVSFDGTLGVSGISDSLPSDVSGFATLILDPAGIIVSGGLSERASMGGGVTTGSGLSSTDASSFFDAGFSFGYAGTTIFWDDSLVTGGSAASPTELTLDSSNHFYVIADADLEDVVGTASTGDVLWTANVTDDTIQIGSIPEPSSIALLGLGSIGLLARRKRSA